MVWSDLCKLRAEIGCREDSDEDDDEVEINEDEEGSGLDLIGLWLIMTLFLGMKSCPD